MMIRYLKKFYYEKSGSMGENSKSQFLFLLDGIVINAAYVFTTGVMISGYAIYLGASDFVVALLNNSCNYATILSVFAFFVFERASDRKKTLLALNFASRSLVFLIILLPLIYNGDLKFILLCAMVILSDVIWGIYRVGWLIWMIDIVPDRSRNQYIYFRMFFVRIFVCIATILGGFILDFFNKEYLGFFIIYIIAFLLSLTDVYILKKINEGEYKNVKDKVLNLQNFFQPVKSGEYIKFLLFCCFFYLIYTMSTSFSSVYMIKYMNFSYIYITAANAIALLVMIASNRVWGRIESKKGVKFVLSVTTSFLATELLILSFLNRGTAFLLIFSSIISGIGMGGFGVSTMTYRYEVMPKDKKIVFESWFYFFYGSGMLLAPFIGKVFLQQISFINNIISRYSAFQILYLISFIFMLLLLLIVFIRPAIIKKTDKTSQPHSF